MELPKDVILPSGNEFIICISWYSLGERWGTSEHYEKNYSSCKDINLLTIIVLSSVDLGSHIPFGSKDSS
jgi:hypothetical protein